MKKKIFAMGMAFIMLLLCACGGEIAPENDTQTPTVEDPASPEKQPSPTVNEEEPFDYSKITFLISGSDIRSAKDDEELSALWNEIAAQASEELLLKKCGEGGLLDTFENVRVSLDEPFSIEQLKKAALEEGVFELFVMRDNYLKPHPSPVPFDHGFVRPGITDPENGIVIIRTQEALDAYRAKYEEAIQNLDVNEIAEDIQNAQNALALANEEGFFEKNVLLLIDLTDIDISNIGAIDVCFDYKTKAEELYVYTALLDIEQPATENAGGTLVISLAKYSEIDFETEVNFEIVQMPQSNP
ncbi:MAG: hypothetical protein E7616_06965 [Ruminococcaceae bacterium]|nr:hypothetical protein [Oscillospiraceae bacterium]